jgi:hypothetical protein
MGSADMSLGDRQPETRISFAVGSCQHGQQAIRGFAGLLENLLEIGGRAKATDFGKTVAKEFQASDGQPLAAFGTAGIDDIAATAGFHSGTETVGAHTLDFAGLPSSFHGVPACFCSGNTKTWNANAGPKDLSILWISWALRYSIRPPRSLSAFFSPMFSSPYRSVNGRGTAQ